MSSGTSHNYFKPKKKPPEGHKEWGIYCATCGGFEKELMTHCPERKMEEEEKARVIKLELDFINGQFHHYVFKTNKEEE